MKFALFGFLAFLLGIGSTAARVESQCGVFTVSESADALHTAIYSFGGSLVDELFLSRDTWVRQSRLRSGSFKIAVLLDDGLRFYEATANGVEYLLDDFSTDYVDTAPRLNPWSYDGRYLALVEIMVSRTSRLFVLDTMRDVLYQPTHFTDVFGLQWSPSRNLFAFVGYDSYFDGGTLTNVVSDYGLYVSDVEGTVSAKVPIEQDTFARFHWLNGDQIVVTSCEGFNCTSVIYDVETHSSAILELGEFLLDDYLPSLDRYLVSRIPDRNVFLTSGVGDLVQVSHAEEVLSRPIVSFDESYISFRAQVAGRYVLQILNLNTSQIQSIDLSDEVPPLLTSNSRSSFPPIYNFYFEHDSWHSETNLLLYADENQVFVFDPLTNESKRVVAFDEKEELRTYQWVC